MSPSEQAPRQDARVTTGVPGLDGVLGGGLVTSGVYIVVGEPGAGKTLFANQLCYHQGRGGARCLYVTLLAESHARMLANMRDMAFFDSALLPESVYYVSGFRTLEEQGLPGLLELLRREVRNHNTSILVLDGLVQAQEAAGSSRDFKKFIHELQVSAGLSRFTALMLTSSNGPTVHPEYTMVDGILELRERTLGVRSWRELQVRKFRGGATLSGVHTFRISNDGLEVFPRLEARMRRTPPPDPGSERVHFGIPSMDALFPGGLAKGSTSLMLGPPGSGKTLMGSSLLAEGLKQGERCLYMGFYESPERLLHKAAAAGMDMGGAVKDGRMHILWQPPAESILDVLADQLLSAVRRHQVTRVFVDGLSAMSQAAPDSARMASFFAALTQELRLSYATTIFSLETPRLFGPALDVPLEVGPSAVAENLFFLRHVELEGRLRRLLTIFKLRDTDYDPSIREFRISRQGIEVLPPFDVALDTLLTGLARHRTGGHP
ncbi:AAA family ATPase [Myxococcus sp. CA051A]|uniref:ATPase domain-containing protein n=1 Tax=unclassified Myxococcus TaxID=2648731 RepID=UPI00157B697C|nr:MULTISPECIES: ATPase domain-containing protein [unclassified Myxococcus]NTX09774.1 AAA family ATPase [Myxococcus sp. CA056]NTX35134.1 AAA family ATPase [Myxococcus sp. CA033]NTX50566.1 AAA family ATPase [Myxococcus sp. CA039A]NTX65101.1 AAA family ATPase [Myxococcus sp. CA051A]